MASMARVNLIGNLGRDSEMKYIGSGTGVLEFSIAVNIRFKEQGEFKETTNWYRVSFWGNRGEKIKPYLTKGKQVFVTGTLNVREYTSRDGNKGTSLDVRADDVQLLGGRGEGGGAPGPSGGGGGGGGAPFAGNDSSFGDDDIPF